MNRTVIVYAAVSAAAAVMAVLSAIWCPLLLIPSALVTGFLIFQTVQAGRLADLIARSHVLSGRELEHDLYRQVILLNEYAGSETNEEITSALVNTQAEMTALQNQINPHFLYNTLDTIRGQALINDAPVVADMAEALSVLFRYSISNQGSLVSLKEELYCIDKYLSIQQIRFRGRFQVEKHTDPDLMDCLIPRLTLEPVVENAIFHGLECTSAGGTITIETTNCGEYMVIDIRDNGIGMDEETLERINDRLQSDTVYTGAVAKGHGLGIALVNVNKRIRLTFGDSYGLSVSSVPGMGTDVSIIIPIVYQKEEAEEDGT